VACVDDTPQVERELQAAPPEGESTPMVKKSV
jgi:hypothetical protein